MRREIVGRNVDEVARQEDSVADADKGGGIDAIRHDEPGDALLRLAVAIEAVGAEREGERGERRLLDAIRQPVEAGRQRRRQLAEEERAALGRISRAKAEQHAADAAGGVGQDRHAAGFRLEALRGCEAPLAFAKRGKRTTTAPPP